MTQQKADWEKPEARFVGNVKQLVHGGGGKTSNFPADPGEPRKPTPKIPDDPA